MESLTPASTALQRIGIRQQLDIFIPRFTYFLILFILARTAADALGLIAISGAVGAFFAYLPNIVAALLLMILGTSLGQFAGEMVTQSGRMPASILLPPGAGSFPADHASSSP